MDSTREKFGKLRGNISFIFLGSSQIIEDVENLEISLLKILIFDRKRQGMTSLTKNLQFLIGRYIRSPGYEIYAS